MSIRTLDTTDCIASHLLMGATDTGATVVAETTSTLSRKVQDDTDFELFRAQAESIDDDVEFAPAPTAAPPECKGIGDNKTSAESVISFSYVTTVVDAHPTDVTSSDSPAEKRTDMNDSVGEEQSRRFVSPKDFDLLKVVGMGAFGKVLQVRNKQSQQVLAMKIISKRLLRRKGDSVIENVLAERNILKRLGRHPFVVAMHCSFQTRDKLFIIMDFLAGGELFQRLGKEGIFLEKTALFYLAEIISALEHLHLHGVLHRDLKPENILLSSDGHVCLTDFGLAKDFASSGFTNGDNTDESHFRALTICGTGEYMAPEMIARMGYGKAADYWSLGCLMYEMLGGRPPFESKQGAKVLFTKIMTEKVKMPAGCSAPACKLIKGLLNRNVAARLGAAKSSMFEVGGVAGLKQQEFFAGIDWDKLVGKQIPPPAVFNVDHDGDVQHFHEEFTQMPLPRSVIEMSIDDFTPRRVESDKFRGFSFIQDDFLLPERDQMEERSYWDSIDEDGESVSECASSKMGDVLVEAVQQLTQQPTTGKRPPRKRKKKPVGQITGSCVSTPAGTAANTPHASRSNTPEPSEIGDLVVQLDGLLVDTERNEEGDATVSKPTVPQVTVPDMPLPPQPVVNRPPETKQPWQTAKNVDTAVKSKHVVVANQKSLYAGQGIANRPVPPWSRTPSTTAPTPARKSLPASNDESWRTTKSPVKSNRQLVGTPPIAPVHHEVAKTTWTNASPTPTTNGGWSSIAAISTAPTNRTVAYQQHPHQSSLPAPSSSDWRNHSMSVPNLSPHPTMTVPSLDSDGPVSWPTLGGLSTSKESSKQQLPVVKGAWATTRR